MLLSSEWIPKTSPAAGAFPRGWGGEAPREKREGSQRRQPPPAAPGMAKGAQLGGFLSVPMFLLS